MFGKKTINRTDDRAEIGEVKTTYASPVDFTSPPAQTVHIVPAIDQAAHELSADVLEALYATIDVSRLGALTREKAQAEIEDIVSDIVTLRGLRLSTAEQGQITRVVIDDILGFGPLESLLAQDDIADIMVNSSGLVFVERNGMIEQTNISFRDDEQLLQICQRLAAQTGRHVDRTNPICDARLLDGSRVNIVLPPLAVKGPTLTIRKFQRERLRLRDLVDYGSVSPAGARLLAVIAACQCNVIVSGGTGSGKTTLLNCLTAFIHPRERVITCEDTAELQLQQPHVVSLETRPPNLEGYGSVNMTDLVRNCLRMRPERIIVGEVRGPEAMDLLQAMNTGHDGSMGTLHANSPRDALSRMESLICMGAHSLPIETIRKMICSAVDIIVQTMRMRDGSRRITAVTEILRMDNGVYVTQDLMTFKVTGEVNDKIIGEHVSSGISRPHFWDRAKYFGLEKRLQEALIELGAPDFGPVEQEIGQLIMKERAA